MYCFFLNSTTDPIITATVTPTSYSGKDVQPFNTFSLTCTAMKPSSVIPSLQLNWYHDGMQLDSSVSGITITEQDMNNGMEKSSVLSVTSASAQSSGSYTCNVTVSIPVSNTLTTNQAAIVIIAGT